jgi:hypothetical protein
MRIKLWMVLALFAMPVLVFAQTNAPTIPTTTPATPTSGAALLITIIPLLVPIIVALLKKLMQFLPSWSLPILAAALGELLNFISGLLGGPSVGVLAGVALGAAGTGVREIVDQLKQKIAPGSVTPIILFALALPALSGCAGGPVQVKEGSDPLVVYAEWTAENAANTIDTFLEWERKNEARLKRTNPAIHAAANNLRDSATGEIRNLRNLTKQYKADRNDANGSSVRAATNALLALVNSIRGHMGLGPVTPPSLSPTASDLMKITPTNGPPPTPPAVNR